MSIKQNFSTLRQRSGLTIEEVAKLTGYSLRTVYRWEKDETVPRRSVWDNLERYFSTHANSQHVVKSDFRFVDLFAGIGGLRMAFERAGGKCVFTSEWNKYSVQTYMANFSCDHPVHGDITQIDECEVPSHDVLVAGFPCQPFSIAGVSKKNALGRPHGFLDQTQGTLFFDIARILRYHQPNAFLLENVKNLVSHDKGRTFKVIEKTLRELGYHIQWRILDAKAVLPQHRERIFIVGFREQTAFNFESIDYPEVENGPVLNRILHPEDGTELPEPPYTHGETGSVDSRYTLSPKLWDYLQEYARKHRAKGNGFGYGLVGHEDVARTLSARYYKDGSEILIRQKGDRPRRLTPRECARLMGFDSFAGQSFCIPVSDTQAYQQFGNAVAVPVVERIAQAMAPFINTLRQETRQMELFDPASETANG